MEPSSNRHSNNIDCQISAAAAGEQSSTIIGMSTCTELHVNDREDCGHQEKESMQAKQANATSCHCTCAQRNNLIRIDNYAKGLHVDIHRGLFSSKNNASNNNVNNNDWYQKLLDNVQWHRVKYKSNRFQKECETPCWTAFYGGRSEYHPYMSIPSWFQPLIDEVTSHLGKGAMFNAFLLRLYFDGKDEIAWHTDGRTFLGEEPTIASLSLGCKATFQLRRMNDVWPCADGSKSTEGCVDTSTPIESFVLSDGDLLVMRGKTQKHWHHRVPKEKGRGVRLNINFRYVMPGLDAERGQKTYYKYMVYGDCPMDKSPPSWSFEEIMAKRGGIMNFVKKGVKRKEAGCAEDTNGQSTKSTGASKSEECTAYSTADGNGSSIQAEMPPIHHSTMSNDNKSSTSCNTDTQQYLASEQGIDKEVFMSLPVDIQHELVSQWKSRQLDYLVQSESTRELSRPTGTMGNKRLAQSKNGRISKAGKKAGSDQKKGTLDSFFKKK